ncbi:MAG: hypothetical protein QG670_1542 [Thermoproteota archaeon]|nr:hypothetical protein [Thermoproteota archaeon]
MSLIELLLILGISIPAFLAIYFEEIIYSVVSLVVMFVTVSIFYFSLDAPLAAIFQLTLGIGTAVTLILVGDEITAGETKPNHRNKLTLAVTFILLLTPLLILELPLIDIRQLGTISEPLNFPLSEVLWNLRGIDILAQGLVVLTAIIGLAILLRKNEEVK